MTAPSSVSASVYHDGGAAPLPRNRARKSQEELLSEVCQLIGTGLSRSDWEQYASGIPYRDGCRKPVVDRNVWRHRTAAGSLAVGAVPIEPFEKKSRTGTSYGLRSVLA